MSVRFPLVAAAAAALSLTVLMSGVALAGPLDPPPGPIASTPGPEPRTPLTGVTTPGDADSFFRITSSGSYCLPRSFAFTAGEIGGKSAVEIDADNVTIDLNGFTLNGGGNGLHAIRVAPGRQRVTVVNGVISNWLRGGVSGEAATSMRVEGLSIGNVGTGTPGAPAVAVDAGSIVRDVSTSGAGGATAQPGVKTGHNCIVERVAVTATTGGGIDVDGDCVVRDCTAWSLAGAGVLGAGGTSVSGCTARGCTGNGVSVGLIAGDLGGAVTNCQAFNNAGVGIYSASGGLITGCVAVNNTGTGIECGTGGAIADCTAQDNLGHGFSLGTFGVISRCAAYSNAQNGIDCVFGGNRVQQCVVANNDAHGIRAAADTAVIDNTVDNHSSGAGIITASSDVRIEGNTCTDNNRGIDLDAAGCLVVRNVCAGNTTNFDIIAGNVVGVIVNAPLSAAIVGSAGGAGVGTTDPWANVSY